MSVINLKHNVSTM